MTEKTFTNNQLITILNRQDDDQGKALRAKKLPAKLLYAIRRSAPQMAEAYQAYHKALADICASYGATPDKIVAADPERQEALANEVVALINEKTTVRVHTISPEVLDLCGNGIYDALTYTEVDRLFWLIQDD